METSRVSQRYLVSSSDCFWVRKGLIPQIKLFFWDRRRGMVSLKSHDEFIPPANDFTCFDRGKKVRGGEDHAIGYSVNDHKFF